MKREGGRHGIWLMGLAGALVLSGVLVLLGLSVSRASADAASGWAAVDEILAQPRRYLDRQVTVRGVVLRVWGNGIVALRSHPVRQGLLVVLGEAGTQEGDLREGQEVEVSGQIHPLSRSELSGFQQLGLQVRDDVLLALYGRDPYLLADEVRPAGASR